MTIFGWSWGLPLQHEKQHDTKHKYVNTLKMLLSQMEANVVDQLKAGSCILRL